MGLANIQKALQSLISTLEYNKKVFVIFTQLIKSADQVFHVILCFLSIGFFKMNPLFALFFEGFSNIYYPDLTDIFPRNS